MVLHILLLILRGIGFLLLGVLALLVVLLIPAGARVSYDQGDLAVWVRYGPVRIQVLPKKEAPEGEAPARKKKPKKEKKPKAETAEQEEKEKAKQKFRVNLEQILYTLDRLPPILGKALRGVGRGIRLDPLKVHLLIAGPDPADTALLYGRLYGALTVGVPEAERLLRIRSSDIRLFVDFQADKPDCIADVGVSLRPILLVAVALRAGVGALGWFLGFRKLAGPADKPSKKNKKQSPDDTNTTEAA